MIKSGKKLLDTNTIIRYLLKDNLPLFEKANKFFEKVRLGEEKVIILESVLVECVYVLTKFYNVPRKEVSQRLKELLRYKGVTNDDLSELVESLTMFSAENIDIVDCILCVKSKKDSLTLFTFDQKLEKYFLRQNN